MPHPDVFAIQELRTDLFTLDSILKKYSGQQEPGSPGLRITRQIFLEALSDAAVNLKSICDYLESKTPGT